MDAPTGRPTGLPPAEPDPLELRVSMEEHHAEFVASHLPVEPGGVPEGAAGDVQAVVEHLHAVAEVLDVIEEVEAEGRVVTADELERLEQPQAVLAASDFPDPPG